MVMRSTDAGGRTRKRGFAMALTTVALAIGLVLIYLPDMEGAVSQHRFDKKIDEIDAVAGELASGGSRLSDEAAAYSELFSACEAYNRILAGEGQQPNDPFAYSGAGETFSNLGAPDGLVGYLSVPSICCDLPLYFGSTYEHMAQGATIVAGTSVPLGELNSNCVIAAHRGWSGAAMFRDIEELETGDAVTIATPWDTLEYRVESFKVVEPGDTESILIQPGRDMVTLLTCHPYGSNASRYLVYCSRDIGNWEPAVEGGSGVAEASGETRPATLPEIEKGVKRAVSVVLALSLLTFLGRVAVSRLQRKSGR